jgi:hypothetical protein
MGEAKAAREKFGFKKKSRDQVQRANLLWQKGLSRSVTVDGRL